MILMVDSADHITGKTGLTLTVTLSKDGAAFAAIGGSVTEISSGWYKLALNTTDTGTLGDLAIHATATGADPTDVVDQVVVLLPGDAVTLQADQAVNVTKVAGTTQTARDLGAQLDATVSSRMATYTQPTGFLAATFPSGTVASTTNITAGTITTTTNLTNLPSIPANWITAAGITAAALNGKGDWNIGKTGYALTVAEEAAIADKLLGRNLNGGSDGTRTVQDALRVLRNKVSVAAGTVTVTKEDDTTTAWTGAVTTTAGNPISAIDPA